MTGRLLAAVLGVALAAGWALGWFAVGPLIGSFLGHGAAVRLPVPSLSAPASRGGVQRHLASLSPVSAVPVPRPSRRVVTYVPPPARPGPRRTRTPRPVLTPVPSHTPAPVPTPTPVPTPSVSPSPAPSSMPTDMPTATPGTTSAEASSGSP